ncbi:nucleotidyltransferase domain-containing protein [Thermococcus sp. GR6]|uniref:nucleotidyltransferase domain-containing protein n=1 Tax=Thermococcus sp. GR6 TaxID=1638256 RepID=UPI003519EA77
METDWHLALEKFIEDWKIKDFVEAALLTGSYAVGLQTRYSDVDFTSCSLKTLDGGREETSL